MLSTCTPNRLPAGAPYLTVLNNRASFPHYILITEYSHLRRLLLCLTCRLLFLQLVKRPIRALICGFSLALSNTRRAAIADARPYRRHKPSLYFDKYVVSYLQRAFNIKCAKRFELQSRISDALQPTSPSFCAIT